MCTTQGDVWLMGIEGERLVKVGGHGTREAVVEATPVSEGSSLDDAPVSRWLTTCCGVSAFRQRTELRKPRS